MEEAKKKKVDKRWEIFKMKKKLTVLCDLMESERTS